MATQAVHSRAVALPQGSLAAAAPRAQQLASSSSLALKGLGSLKISGASLSASSSSKGLQIRCAGPGGFIPGEHRWMYEGVEKLGPVSRCL